MQMTMENEMPAFCENCGIPLQEGRRHSRMQECIEELRLSLKRQSKAAEGLAFEVSTRLFAVLEELAHDPTVAGVRYSTYNHDTGEKLELPSKPVAGVMTAILREYEKMGNWSPMADLKKEHAELGNVAYDLLMALRLIVDDNTGRDGIRSDHLDRAEKVMDAAMQRGVHLRGPGHS
jgi:hypothetical protein